MGGGQPTGSGFAAASGHGQLTEAVDAEDTNSDTGRQIQRKQWMRGEG